MPKSEVQEEVQHKDRLGMGVRFSEQRWKKNVLLLPAFFAGQAGAILTGITIAKDLEIGKNS
jgi:hypothetical protein